MKCLTLTEPWASLVAIGAKTIETRSWKTSHRGPLAIHSAKGFPPEAKAMLIKPVVYEAWGQFGLKKKFPRVDPGFPRGCVIAKCNLVDCIKTEDLRRSAPRTKLFERMTNREMLLGDYSDGRYAWILEDVVPIVPVPAKGALSLWEWDVKGRS